MRHLITACCIAFATPAMSDVTLVYQDAEGKPAYTLSVKGDMMRIDMNDDSHATLFNATREEMIILQPDKREYIVMDRPSVERLQAQMRQAFQMMEQFGMDPAAMGLGKVRSEGVVVQTGETRTVGGHRCNVMNYMVDGALDTISCITAPGRVGISDEDWATIHGMFEMMAKLASDMLPDGMMSADMPPMDGVLIESHGPNGEDRQLLSRIDTASLDAARFQVPSGWKRLSIEIPQMPGMPGRR
ncbi:MAG: hypothetical protein LC632_02550 [Xanthomonadaceae bacterium]|nr:hypothetical protein [Xanthomonadaceae bacterium]